MDASEDSKSSKPPKTSKPPKSFKDSKVFKDTKIEAKSAPKKSFFKTVMDDIGDEILIIDQKAMIVFANKASVHALGYSGKFILSKHITFFLKENISIQQWQNSYFKEIKNKKRPISYSLERKIKNNKIQNIEVTASFVKYLNEEYVIFISRNVSEKLSSDNKLKESENLYRLLSEEAAEGIFTTDLQGIIVYANKAAEDIVKVKRHEACGKHFSRFLTKKSLPKVLDAFKKAKIGKAVKREEINIINKRGKIIPVEFTSSPLYQNGKIFQIHAIIQDVTTKRDMEKMMKETEKMSALQNFVLGTAREIQYPLRGLLDQASNLIESYQNRDFEYIGYKEYQEIFKKLELMRDQISYCFDTTSRLMTAQRKKSGADLKYCDVNRVLREAFKMMTYQLKSANITIKKRLHQNLPYVAIASIDMQMVIGNVLTNAIQAMHAGGEICISTRMDQNRKNVIIDCKDEGVGIKKEALGRVFEPFYTTKLRGLEKSSGLGLSIAYTMIKSIHGHIHIQSNLRKGTHVKIVLPIYVSKKHKKG